MKEHHDAFAAERKDLLKFVRQAARANGYDLRRRGPDALVGGHEDAEMSLDEIASEVEELFPGHLQEESAETGGSHVDQLREMLAHGNPEPMTWDDAYEQALDVLGEGKRPASGDDFDFGANADDETVPLQADVRPVILGGLLDPRPQTYAVPFCTCPLGGLLCGCRAHGVQTYAAGGSNARPAGRR